MTDPTSGNGHDTDDRHGELGDAGLSGGIGGQALRGATLGGLLSGGEARRAFGEPDDTQRQILQRLEQLQAQQVELLSEIRSPTSLAPTDSPQQLGPGRLEGPVRFLVSLRDVWGLSDVHVGRLLGFEDAEVGAVQHLLRGFQSLRGRDAKDRIAHLVVIRHALSGLFKDVRVENDWIREPKAPLDGRNPLDMLTSGSMEDLIAVKHYVLWVSGR